MVFIHVLASILIIQHYLASFEGGGRGCGRRGGEGIPCADAGGRAEGAEGVLAGLEAEELRVLDGAWSAAGEAIRGEWARRATRTSIPDDFLCPSRREGGVGAEATQSFGSTGRKGPCEGGAREKESASERERGIGREREREEEEGRGRGRVNRRQGGR